MNERYFIVGALGQGKVVADILERTGKSIVGFFDDDPALSGLQVFNYPVLGSVSDLYNVYEDDKVIVAIGENHVRKKIANELGDQGIQFGRAVHPFSLIGKDVEIENGSVIMAGATINSGTRIGVHCIINSSSSVDHDNIIGNFAHISPGAVLGGHCVVGELSWVGLGASVKNNVEIGKNVVIGVGSVVIKNIPDNLVMIGNPARVLRENI